MCSIPVHAADSDGQIWLLPTARIPLSDDLTTSIGAGARFSQDAGGLGQLLLRGSVDVSAAKNLTIGIGFGHFQNYQDHHESGAEQRLFQQANWAMGHALGGEWNSRTQLEERFGNGPVGVRFRERIQYRGPAFAGGPVRPVLSVELLADLAGATGGRSPRLNSMRESAGVSIALSQKISLDMAYLNIWAPREGQDKMLHVGYASMVYRF